MKRSLFRAITSMLGASTLFVGAASAHPGWGIVLDGKEQVYFSDVDRNCIWKIDTEGKLSVFVAGKHSHDIVIDPAGDLTGEHVYYDGKEFHGSAWKASPEGVVTGLAPAAPNRGFSPIVDPEGNAYTMSADNHLRQKSQILKVTPKGEISVLAGSEWGYADGRGDKAKFRNFGDMAWGPDGALYVTEGGNVRRVGMDGTVTTLARGLTDDASREKPPFFGLMGIAVDRRGAVYVADYGNRQIRKIAPGGAIVTFGRSRWPWRPTGVAVSGDDVYVLEHVQAPGFLADLEGSPRVRKIHPDGKSVLLASAGSKDSAGRRARVAEPAVEARR